jgi:uncharacterized protein with PIN domain
MDEAGKSAPRFIADAMLGKLARWLRAIGFDTLYMQGDDHAIAARARAEGRILLTRDTELARRKGLHVMLIGSQKLDSQLTQVVQTFGYQAPDMPSRCMNCNGILYLRTTEQVRHLVPPYVAQTQRVFHQCSDCGQVYWQGTHWDKIQKLRNLIYKNAEEM